MLLHGLKQEEHKEVPPLANTHPPQHSTQATVQYEHQTRKRGRDELDYGTHKDDTKGAFTWQQQTAVEQPPAHTTTPPPTSSWRQSQQRGSLLPDPEVYVYEPSKQPEPDPTQRLPSIKHLQLDPAELARSRRHWEYETNTPHPHTYSAPAHPNPSYPSPSQHQRSPLKVTQSIAPPASPPQATELVPVKTNTFGFIETTFTNVPAKKAHRRRPANIDKRLLYCHTCGSKNTPEWRRGPQGPATLCNACGLAYAKRLRQDEENNATAQVAKIEQQRPVHSPHHPPHPSHTSHPTQATFLEAPPAPQYSPYPTLALSDLYQQPGLFHPPPLPPGYQQGFDYTAEHAPPPPPSTGGYAYGLHPAYSPTLSPSYSPSRPTFRSAQNRPNGHTFHQYTPPAAHSRPPSYSSSYPTSNNPHLPLTTTTTTTTTTALYPFGLSPADIPIVHASEPASTTPPSAPSISNSNNLPVLTTLSTSTPADDPPTTYSSLSRFSGFPYRPIPNLYTLYPAPAATTYGTTANTPTLSMPATPSVTSAFPGYASAMVSGLFVPPTPYPPSTASGSSTPAIVATPASYPHTPGISTPSLSSSSHSLSSSTHSLSSTPSISSTSPSEPSPSSSPSSSPARTPSSSPSSSPHVSSHVSSQSPASSSSASRSHSPTLTPITTIAALSNSAAPPSI